MTFEFFYCILHRIFYFIFNSSFKVLNGDYFQFLSYICKKKFFWTSLNFFYEERSEDNKKNMMDIVTTASSLSESRKNHITAIFMKKY